MSTPFEVLIGVGPPPPQLRKAEHDADLSVDGTPGLPRKTATHTPGLRTEHPTSGRRGSAPMGAQTRLPAPAVHLITSDDHQSVLIICGCGPLRGSDLRRGPASPSPGGGARRRPISGLHSGPTSENRDAHSRPAHRAPNIGVAGLCSHGCADPTPSPWQCISSRPMNIKVC